MSENRLTTSAGIPIADNQNSLTAGERGPLLVQDWQLFEKHAHFNRERIPERVVQCQGLRRPWNADHHQRHHTVYQGRALLLRRQEDPMLC